MSPNLSHFTTYQFWQLYDLLPKEIQILADKNYQLLKEDSKHPSLHLKKVAELWSIRVSKGFRALGYDGDEGIVWFWIGTHEEYERILKKFI